MRYTFLVGTIFFLASCNNDTDHSGHTPPKATDTVKSNAATSMSSIMNDMMNEMHAVPTTKDADTDFAALMKAHHQGAVEMARLQIAQGKDSAMINMASTILKDQQKEIDLFDQFLASGKKRQSTSDAFYNETMEDMHKMHGGMEENGSIDMQFVSGMIPHHQGAVDMATVYLKYATDEGLKKLAQSIIAAQKREIVIFQNWIKGQNAQPAIQ